MPRSHFITAVVVMLGAIALMAWVAFASPAGAADKVCAMATYDEFMANVKSKVLKMHTIVPAKMRAYLVNRNAKRFKLNQHPLEADTMIVGELGNNWLGTAMFQDGCLVPGTLESMPFNDMREFFKQSQSEDILDGIGGAK